MPRISCPNNPDCSIDCPGSGYAYYASPYGPCVTGCNQENAGDALIKLFFEAKEESAFFGLMVGVTAGVLARLAQDFGPHAPDDAADAIERLKRLGILESERRFNASWRDAGIADVLHVIAESTGEIGDEIGSAA